MINVTVINLKSIGKYLALAMLLVGICWIGKIASKDINFSAQTFNINLLGCIKDTLPKIENTSKIKEMTTTSKGSGLKKMLGVELPMMEKLIIDGEENEEIIAEEDEEIVEKASTDVTTEEIQEHNITAKFNNTYGTVKIKNESDKVITQDMLIPNISLENNKDVILFHTHTCESYTPSENFNYEMTGSYRTTDLNYSVSRVGTELEKHLKGYGYNVIHDKTYHDYPAYSGSYGRSLTTVKNILNNSSAQVIIDLHRDAIRK